VRMMNFESINIDVDDDLFSAILLVLAPLFLFFGQRIMKAVVFLMSFAAGMYITYNLLHSYTGFSQPIIVLLMVLAGLVAALLVLAIIHASIFFAGAIVGACAGALLSNLIYQLIASYTDVHNPSVAVRVAVLLGFALCGGLIALYFSKILIRLSTSFVGGYAFVAGLNHFGYRLNWWNSIPLDPHNFFSHPQQFQCSGDTKALCVCWGLIGAWIVSFLLGFWFQTYQDQDRTESTHPDHAHSSNLYGQEGHVQHPYILVEVPK